MKQAISINVNGVDHAAEVEPRLLLALFARLTRSDWNAYRLRDFDMRRVHGAA